MSLVLKLRRRGLVGILSKVTLRLWAVYTRCYLGPQFKAMGARTVIISPLFISNPGGMSIGSDVFIRNNVRLDVSDREGEAPGRLTIGAGTTFEQGVHIAACGEVVLGRDVCLAAGVSIVDSHHPAGRPGEGNRVRRLAGGPAFVHVGDRVFIGTGATILRNVTIGDNAIIGAGAVVVRDVPANSVVAGIPAKVVRELHSDYEQRDTV